MKTEIAPKVWRAERLQELQRQQALFSEAKLKRLQKSALQNFLQQGFPSRQVEDWKYTSTAAIAATSYDMAVSSPIAPIQFAELDAYRLAFIDGVFQPQLSVLEGLPAGVYVSTLAQQRPDPDGLLVPSDYQTPFSQLNLALLTDGLFVRVSKGVVVDKPLHLVYYCSPNSSDTMHHPRHVIIAEPESQLSLLEEYRGEAQNSFTNVVTQVYAQPTSTIHHYKIQSESLQASHIANTVFAQQADSAVTSYVISLGAKLARDNLNFAFKGRGASCHLYGVYLPCQSQHLDHHTRVDHRYPNCFSQQIYKGIVAAQARAVFNGKVVVHPHAQKTTAYQNNQNLLLADNAEVNTKPELEIYADDVQCSHGATVGQLDKTALFYLCSRGIPWVVAKRLLVRAFAAEILEKLTEESIKNYVSGLIEQRLERIND